VKVAGVEVRSSVRDPEGGEKGATGMGTIHQDQRAVLLASHSSTPQLSELHGGGAWWRSMVEVRGGGAWWRCMVEVHGGGAWWRCMVEVHEPSHLTLW
jgi:hypothetical protein